MHVGWLETSYAVGDVARTSAWYEALGFQFVEANDGDQEGLGLVVAEAMACCCPVIVGNVPATQDLVDERSGVRVQASNHDQLARAIVTLLRDKAERARMGYHARMHVEQHYSWDAVAERYGQLLADVARAGRT